MRGLMLWHDWKVIAAKGGGGKKENCLPVIEYCLPVRCVTIDWVLSISFNRFQDFCIGSINKYITLK